MAGLSIIDVFGIETTETTMPDGTPVPEGTLAKIVVLLEMGDCKCDQIVIGFETYAQYSLGQTTVDVDDTQNLQKFEFPLELDSNQYLKCGSLLKVKAVCIPTSVEDTGDCFEPADFEAKALRCCPDIHLEILKTADDCNADGTRTVTLSAAVEGYSGYYQWLFGDNQNGVAEQYPGIPVETTHDYNPADSPYIATFKLLAEGNCDQTIEVPVNNCMDAPCPEQIVEFKVEQIDSNGNALLELSSDEVDGCLPVGTYRVAVAAPLGANNDYTWIVNNLFSGSSDHVEFDLAAGEVKQIFVNVEQGECDYPGGLTLTAVADCGDEVCLEVVNELGEVIHQTCKYDNDLCLKAGSYKIRVTSPSGENYTYSWSKDNDLQDETSSELEVELVSGEAFTIGVSVGADCCTLPPVFVTLKGGPVCPDTLSLTVKNSAGDVIETTGCLPIGTYHFEVDPTGAESLTYRWIVNESVVPDENGPTLEGVALANGATAVVRVEATNCCNGVPWDQKVLEACQCPEENIGITVVDNEGNPVFPDQCVAPGSFIAEVTGEIGNGSPTWTQDGNSLSNGTFTRFTFEEPWGTDCGGPPSTTITVTVTSDDPECPDQTASTTLTTCGEFTLENCNWCWLLKLGILIAAGIFAIGLAITICPPAVSSIPGAATGLIPAQIVAIWEPIAAVIVTIAPWVALVAAAIGVFLWAIWRTMCQPDFCGGTLVLIWQLLIGTGVVFIYFGLCPLCITTLLPIGLILITFGIGVFVYWVWFSGCQPSLCKIFFEITNLAIVQTFIGVLQMILAACIWVGGPIVMSIFMGIIWIIGSVGVIWACLAGPPQN